MTARSISTPTKPMPLLLPIRLLRILVFWPLLLFFIWNLIVRLVRHFYKFLMPHFMAEIIDNPLRRSLQPPQVLAWRHGLRPGMVAVDIGPGNGTYTLAAAQAVGPAGKIFALDIEPEMIRRVQRKIKILGVQNIDARLGNVYALPFPNESIDAAYMITVIGEIPDPVRALRELFRVLKPGGTMAFSELLLDPDYPWPRTINRWAILAGFEPVARYGHVLAYTLLFQKPANT